MKQTFVYYPDSDNKPDEGVLDVLDAILNAPSTIVIDKLEIDVTCVHLYNFLTAKVQVRKLTMSHLPTKYVASFNEWLSNTESLETLKIKVCDEDMILDSIKNAIKENLHLEKLTILVGHRTNHDREALEVHLLDTLSHSKIAHLKLIAWEYRNTLMDSRTTFEHLRSFSMFGHRVSLDTNLDTVTLPHFIMKHTPNMHTVSIRARRVTSTTIWNTLSPLAYNDNMETISVGGSHLTQRVGMLLLILIMLKRGIQLKHISSNNYFRFPYGEFLPSNLNDEINKFRSNIQGDPLLTDEYWNTISVENAMHDLFTELLEQVQSNCSLRHFDCLSELCWLNVTPYVDTINKEMTVNNDEMQLALKRSKLSNEVFVREIKKNLGIVDLYSVLPIAGKRGPSVKLSVLEPKKNLHQTLPIAHRSRKRGPIGELSALKSKRIKL